MPPPSSLQSELPTDTKPSMEDVDESVSKGEKNESPSEHREVEEPVAYKTGFRLFIIMTTVNLSTLIASLDLGIVATAIPQITQDFQGLDKIGWYSSACFLLVGVTSAMWGKMFKYLSVKYTYMAALLLYLVGSVVAAAAPNGNALIVGRAIQGWGCAGCLSGSVIIINYTAEPKLRPMLIGTWIAVFMTSTILGPVLGGVFTSELTWRWCFWINLPIGGAALVLQIVCLSIPPQIKREKATWKQLLFHLDLPGFTVLLASVVSFTLALQWGGLTKSWSSGDVVATLVVWIVLTLAFIGIEWAEGSFAMMPLHLIKPRLTWVQCCYGMLSNAYNFQAIFYLPIYFQAVKGTTAILSGVYTLPLVASFAVGATIGGGVAGKTRRIHGPQLASGLLATLGAALLYSLNVDSSKAWYIGAQVPLGLGCGLGNQLPVTILQAFAKPQDLTTITGIVFTFQTLAGSYFIVAAQSIFENRLIQTLSGVAPNIDATQVLEVGATELATAFGGAELAAIRSAYMVGVKDVFAFSIAAAAMTVILVPLTPLVKLPGDESDDQKDNQPVV